jgi:hypothetical protein
MMVKFLLTLAILAGPAAALAGSPSLAGRLNAACHAGVRHVSLTDAQTMCPRPLATTVIAMPRHRTLHT